MNYIDTTGETVLPSGVSKRANGNLMDANRQWASRPADEAVFSADELVARTTRIRQESRTSEPTPWNTMKVEAHGERLCVVGKTGKCAMLTNWSMGQLSAAAGAPAGYLASLPASLAAQNLNYGLPRTTKANDARLLLQTSNDKFTLRAITTDRYTRVWDAEIAEHVHNLCKAGKWGPAQAFKRAGDQAHAGGQKPSALPLGWVGDRSMFVLLVDYDGVIRANGTQLSRFAMISNSEVGAAAWQITWGFLDFVCCNMILWGCQDVYEASLRHVGNVREKWQAIGASMSKMLSSDNRDMVTRSITMAQNKLLGDNSKKVIAVAQAATALPKNLVTDAHQRAIETPRYGNPNSIWAMVNGLTEASQYAANGYADKRAEIDAAAARLMGLI